MNEKLEVVDPSLKSININTLNTVSVNKLKKYLSDVELDYDYIMGKIAFNSYSHISQNKEEPVKNKPVVIWRLNSQQTKIFLDSGSE